MSAMVCEITSVSIACSAVCSGADKKKSKLHVTGLCEGNSPMTGEFPLQRASNAENVSIWWNHHGNFRKILKTEFEMSYAKLGDATFFGCFYIATRLLPENIWTRWIRLFWEMLLPEPSGEQSLFRSCRKQFMTNRQIQDFLWLCIKINPCNSLRPSDAYMRQ